MLDEKEAQDLLGGKPLAKGKKRKTEIEADTELEGRMTDAQTKNKRGRDANASDPKQVKSGALRGVASETMARVYEEIWPSMTTHDDRGRVDLEIAEETYILVNTMVVGNDEEKPRKPLRMREVESEIIPLCKEHS